MPMQPNVFKLEMTPPPPSLPVLSLSPDKPFEMTLKCLATTKQQVVVSLESFFFELQIPRAKKWPLQQEYHVLEPGKTMSFEIKMMRHEPGIYNYEMLRKMTKPEGKLRIYHRTTTQKADDDEDWWGFRIYEDEEGYVPEEERTVEIPMSSEVEWGLFEIELSCEQETEWMEKARKEFTKWKKKADKLKLQKGKKKNKCSVS